MTAKKLGPYEIERRLATGGMAEIFLAREAAHVCVGAFANLTAIVSHLSQIHRPMHLICAGTNGEITAEDVLFADEEERLQPVPAKRIRRMANVRRTDEVESVLRTMQQTGSHLARVVADDGEVVGVVFLEDVIEQLVGEVADASQR